MKKILIIILCISLFVLAGCASDEKLVEKANQMNNVGVCAEVKNNALWTNCINGLALKNKDVSMCLEFRENPREGTKIEQLISGCIQYAAIKTQDEALCQYIDTYNVKIPPLTAEQMISTCKNRVEQDPYK